MNTLWRTLAAAPHRLLFLAGTIQTLLAMLWWGLSLESRFGNGLLVPPAMNPSAAHGWLMLYGVFPFFIFGFLFTALPNWVNGAKIPRAAYLSTALLMAIGAALFYPGIYNLPIAAVALLLHGTGWAIGLSALYGVLRTSAANQDKRQPWLAWAAMLGGLTGLLSFLAWQATNLEFWLRSAMALGIWWFLVPLFLAVCHRMVPWFTSRVVTNYVIVRPYLPLWIMVIAGLLHGVLEILELAHWTWLADLPLAGLAVWFITRWGIARTLHERLLAMLHIGFVWATLSFILYGLGSLLGLIGATWSLGLAPLHALGIGFFGSMLLAMASRVSLGHSGRPLKADGLTWRLFWLVQVAALVRMAPDLLPASAPYRIISLASLLWLVAFGLWAWQYAPLFWRPRADGKPG